MDEHKLSCTSESPLTQDLELTNCVAHSLEDPATVQVPTK